MRLKDTKTVKAMIDRMNAGGGSVDIATEINASSTNEEAAGAKAVYDFVNTQGGGGYKIVLNNTVPGATNTEITDEDDKASVKNAFDKLNEDITDIPECIIIYEGQGEFILRVVFTIASVVRKDTLTAFTVFQGNMVEIGIYVQNDKYYITTELNN